MTPEEIAAALRSADALSTQRLAAIEERPLALETRQHPPQ